MSFFSSVEQRAGACCAIFELDGHCRDGFGDVKDFVYTESDPEQAEYALKFLVELIGDEADADVCFDPPFCEVEDGAGFECAFGNAEGALNDPQTMILVYDFRGWKDGVCNVAFESVPLCIGGDFRLVYADHDIVLNDKEFVVTTLIDILFLNLAGGVGLAQTLYAFVSVVAVFGGALLGVTDNDALIAVYDSLVEYVRVFFQ